MDLSHFLTHQSANTLFLGAISLILWFAKQTLSRIEKGISGHSEKLDNHETRISHVEGKIAQRPL